MSNERITATEYQQAASRTLISAPDGVYTPEDMEKVLTLIRMSVNAGAQIEYFKKTIFHGQTSVKLPRPLEYYEERALADRLSDADIMNMWNLLGLLGEASEVAREILMAMRAGRGISREDLTKELGDVLWYVAALCSHNGLSLSDVMDANIKKLQHYYPNGYSREAAAARADTTE